MDRRPFLPAPRRRGPLAALPENDRPRMASAFLEVLHHALPLGLCTVNGRSHPEQGLVGLPIISPEKLALPRPARGAPLASSLAGFFRETGGQWDHTRAPAPARQSGPLPLHMAFLPPRRVNLDLT